MKSRNAIDNVGEESELLPFPNDDVYEATCTEGYRLWRQRCIPCGPGTYSNTENAIRCLRCSGNTIAAGYSSTSCTECPTGLIAVGGTYCRAPYPAPTVMPVEAPTEDPPTRPTRNSPICRNRNGCNSNIEKKEIKMLRNEGSASITQPSKVILILHAQKLDI